MDISLKKIIKVFLVYWYFREKYFDLFDRVINCPKTKWLSILKKNNDEIIHYNLNNLFVKKEIKNFLISKNSKLTKYIKD